MKYTFVLATILSGSSLVFAADDPYAGYPSVAETASINGFADPIYAELPECAKSCVVQNTGITPCPYWDTGCLCVMPQFQDLVAACIAENCEGSNVVAATSLANSICTSAGANTWNIAASLSTALSEAAAETATTTDDSTSTEATTTSSSTEVPETSSTATETSTEEPTTSTTAPITSSSSTETAETTTSSTEETTSSAEGTTEASSEVTSAAVKSSSTEETTASATTTELISSSSSTLETSSETPSSEESTSSETTTSQSASSAAVSSIEQVNAGSNKYPAVTLLGSILAGLSMFF